MLKRLLRRKKRVGEPLYLNVYDLTPANRYLYWFGLGIYHSAVEAHGVEYAFGAHDLSSSGIFEMVPQSCPGFEFRRRIKLGTTHLSSKDFKDFMKQIAVEYSGNTYHLVVKNCNHFSSDVSARLTGYSIPGWVNRLAKVGKLCNCFLPDELQVTAALEAAPDSEGKSVKSRKSGRMRLSDDSVPRRSFLRPFRRRVFPWNWRTSISHQKFRQLSSEVA